MEMPSGEFGKSELIQSSNWIVQRKLPHRAPAERIPANMTSTNEEEHSDGVRLVGPKHGSGKADSCSRS